MNSGRAPTSQGRSGLRLEFSRFRVLRVRAASSPHRILRKKRCGQKCLDSRRGQAPHGSRHPEARRGQAIIEYILLIAVVSTLSFAYLKFYGSGVFGPGLRGLQSKMQNCLSHSQAKGKCK